MSSINEQIRKNWEAERGAKPAPKKVDQGELRVTHDHTNRRTRLVRKLRGVVIASYPWLPGIITRREAMKRSGL